MRTELRSIALFVVVVFAMVWAHADDGKPAWSNYRSEKWQFCAAYPNDWTVEELFDGEMLKAVPKGSADETEITLGAFRNQHGEGEGPQKPLEAIAEDAEDDLRDSMVRDLQTRNQSVTIAGLPALVTQQSYLRGSEPFRAKEVRIKREDTVVIELVLRAPETKFGEVEQGFDQMVQKQFSPKCSSPVPK